VHQLEDLLRLAESIAVRAAEHLRTGLERSDLDVTSKGTDTDLVTDVDRTGERLIVGLLHDARPDDGIVGEEGTQLTGRSGVDWIIDPLDGTTNFVYRHPGFSVSIAATVDGVPAIGVVADPMQHDLFSARQGGGAHRNGVPISCSPLAHLPHALVATGFAYDPAQRRQQAEVLTTVLPSVRDIRRMGGAAVDLCSVACGRVDAYYERGLQPWDMAAGVVIAVESGARVGDLRGGPPSADCCLAAPPALFEPLAQLLADA
jgi:myo-inositol-1(or 4)-monophosphatase